MGGASALRNIYLDHLLLSHLPEGNCWTVSKCNYRQGVRQAVHSPRVRNSYEKKKKKKESNGIFLLDDQEHSIHPSSMSQSRLFFSLPSDFLTGDSDDGVAVYWSCDLQIPSIDIHLPPQVGRSSIWKRGSCCSCGYEKHSGTELI